MQQVEELRRRTEEGKDRIRQARIAMERTWWDHLVEHVSSSAPAAGHMAVSTAPFFQDVPDRDCQAYSHRKMWTPRLCGKPLKKACPTSTGEGGRRCIEHPIGLFTCLRALAHTSLSSDWSLRIRLLLSLTFAAPGAKISTMIRFGRFLLRLQSWDELRRSLVVHQPARGL